MASRVAWTLTYGPIPKGLLVCHTCDNPACCNVAHMFLGTTKDNAQDSVKKGRSLLGEKNPAHRLTTLEVQQIRRLYSDGTYSYRQIAAMFAVSSSTIYDIKVGKTWKHI